VDEEIGDEHTRTIQLYRRGRLSLFRALIVGRMGKLILNYETSNLSNAMINQLEIKHVQYLDYERYGSIPVTEMAPQLPPFPPKKVCKTPQSFILYLNPKLYKIQILKIFCS